MTDLPKRIWVNPDVEYADRDKQYGCNIEYHRADLSADLVRAGYLAGLKIALIVIGTYDEFATCSECCDVTEINKAVTRLSADPGDIAAIVAQVMEKE